MKLKSLLYSFLFLFFTQLSKAQSFQPDPTLLERLQKYAADNRLYPGGTYIYFDSLTKKPYRFSPKDFIAEDLSQPFTVNASPDAGVSDKQLRGVANNFHLVKDINALTDADPKTDITISSNENHPFAVLKNATYFVAEDGIHGTELWRTDGSAKGTNLVKDIATGTQNIFAYAITASDSNIFLLCSNYATAQYELIKSDGTEAGTVLVKAFGSGYNFSTFNLCNVNNTVYFSINDKGLGKEQLWKTDGTEEGTVAVKDFAANSNLHSFVSANGFLFFAGSDAANGAELWRSNGTDTGTFMLKDINPGYNDYSSGPVQLTAYNGKLYFSEITTDFTNKNLWMSDGTSEGTKFASGHNEVRLSNNTSANLYFNKPFIISRGKLYTLAYQVVGAELYTYDAADTIAGLHLVKDLHPGTESTSISESNMAEADGVVYFFDRDFSGSRLYITNGTADSTIQIKDFPPFVSTSGSYGSLGRMFFSLFDSTYGYEPWVSDGTTSGTVLLEDVYPGDVSSSPMNFTFCNDKVLFKAISDKYGSEIFGTTGSGAQLVAEINTTSTSSSRPIDIIAINDGVITEPTTYDKGNEIWKATSNDATLLKDLVVGSNSGNPTFFSKVNNLVYFTADSLTYGIPYTTNLYKSDGTPQGTVKITNLSLGSRVTSYTVTEDGTAFYTIIGSSPYPELWKIASNSTIATKLHTFSNIRSSFDYTLQRYYTLVAAGKTVYFGANDNTTSVGMELWKSDGTVAGTVVVKDINAGSNSSDPQYFTAYNGSVYFTANDGTDVAFWKSDGTDTGTFKMKLLTGVSTSPTVFNNLLYFTANDGTAGSELWRTDGTITGTVLVKDINAGATSSYPNSFTDVNGTLFFFAYNAGLAPQLWKTDGTSEGTVWIKDIDTAYANIGNATLAGGKFFFTVWGKIWASDGTSNGTGTVLDDNGNIASVNYYLKGNGNHIYFTSYTYQYGYELWSADATQIVLPVSLISFNASLQNKDIIAKWQTATEINTAYFNIQRSTDGVHFTNAGKVTAKGNSNTTQSYSFPDVNIADAVSVKTIYYRLQTVDKDGKISLSNVAPVNLNWKNVVMIIHPNPAKDIIKVRLNNDSGNAIIELYDINGKKIKSQQQTVQSGNEILLNISSLQAGVYVVKTNLNGKILQQKFVKQ